jgi:hypothetical protein
VNETPGFRIEPGRIALLRLYHAPNHTLSHAQLKAEFGALQAHLGWFFRRVAEELGVQAPEEYDLFNKSTAPDGGLLFTLRSSVVEGIFLLRPRRRNPI